MLENLLRPSHLFLVLGIALLFFGGKKIPELARGMGEGVRGFRDAITGSTVEKPTTGESS
jgi:sec-independent protein translocase protein TatA